MKELPPYKGGQWRSIQPIAELTDNQIATEIQCYERRPFNGRSKWAMRLFDLRQEVKRRKAEK